MSLSPLSSSSGYSVGEASSKKKLDPAKEMHHLSESSEVSTKLALVDLSSDLHPKSSLKSAELLESDLGKVMVGSSDPFAVAKAEPIGKDALEYKKESDLVDWNDPSKLHNCKQEDLDCWIRPMDRIPAPNTLALIKGSGPVGDFTGISGRPIQDFIARISSDAQIRELSPKLSIPEGKKATDPEATLTHVGKGFEYKWTDDGDDFVIRIHGKDHSQPLGKNAGDGWTARIEKGDKTLSSEGVWYDKNTTLTAEETVHLKSTKDELEFLTTDTNFNKNGLSPDQQSEYDYITTAKASPSAEDKAILKEINKKLSDPLDAGEKALLKTFSGKKTSLEQEQSLRLQSIPPEARTEKDVEIAKSLGRKKENLTPDEEADYNRLKDKKENPKNYLNESDISNYERIAGTHPRISELEKMGRDVKERVQYLKGVVATILPKEEKERRMNNIHIPVTIP